MSEEILESHITSVTVYRTGAYVTRLGVFEGAVPSQLRFVDLPLSLEDTTVSCRIVVSDKETTEGGLVVTDSRVALDSSLSDEGEGAEANALLGLRIKIRQLRGRSRYLREELGSTVKLVERPEVNVGEMPQATPLAARLALLEFSKEAQRALYAEVQAEQEELEQALRNLEELEGNTAHSHTDSLHGAALRKSVIVSLSESCTERVEVELQYFVPGACWAPSYGLHIQDDLNSAELSMRAMVCQRSGEDWSGVQLTLSTAELQRWAEVPTLKSKRIGRRQEQPPQKGWRPPPTGTQDLYADYDCMFGDSPVAGPGAPAAVHAEASPVPLFGGAAPEDAYEEMQEDFDYLVDDENTAEILEKELAASDSSELSGAAPAKQNKKLRMALPSAPSPVVLRSMAPKAGGGGGAASPSELEDVQVDDALLNYGSLRMSGATSHFRGELRLTTATAVYVEYLASEGKKVSEDDCEEFFLTAEAAYETAQDIAAVPAGHTLAWAQDYDYVYHACAALDLASDGQFHSLPIMSVATECVSKHVVVPRESTNVFRTLTLSNAFDAPLLPGPMDVYWHNDFVVTSSVSLTAPLGNVDIGMGVDQAVKVTRNTNYRENTVGLMGGALELHHKVQIEVANHSVMPVDLYVRERVPVASSQADDIKVEIKNVSPDWSVYEQPSENVQMDMLQGGFYWRLELDAGQRQELTAAYEIRLPSKYELRGGNRREW